MRDTTLLLTDADTQPRAHVKGTDRTALVDRIARWTGAQNGPLRTAIPGLRLSRYEERTGFAGSELPPGICVAAQGAKRVLLGDETYVYDAHHFLVAYSALPVLFQVTEASPVRPYLGLSLTLDPQAVAQLMLDSSLPPPNARESGRGPAVGEVTSPMVDALGRLIDLLDSPGDIPILSPLILREITYRLLMGEQGRRLRQIAAGGSRSHDVARVIDWLKIHYAQPLRVRELASYARMSASALYHHFHALTAMSPLQYQKWLRLHEARRLMLIDRLDVATAAFQVGYESPSQFSREYARLFGAPPRRDIANLRQSSVETGAASAPSP